MCIQEAVFLESLKTATHAILNLINDIMKSIEKDEFTLGIFVDLLKVFNSVNHDILSTKLHNYDVRGNCLKQLKGYLANRMQYIYFDQNKKATLESILCGVLQRSILGSLLFFFFIFAYNLCMTSSLLTPTMFTDDINLFLSD